MLSEPALILAAVICETPMPSPINRITFWGLSRLDPVCPSLSDESVHEKNCVETATAENKRIFANIDPDFIWFPSG
jgi:hypothetical protein